MMIGDREVLQTQVGEHIIYNGWRQYTGISQFFSSFTLLYRVHPDEKYLEIIISGVVALNATSNGSYQLIDMSPIAKGISIDVLNFNIAGNQNGARGYSASVKDDVIYFAPLYNTVFAERSVASSVGAKGNPFIHISYESLV